ncbi:hypothetical protein T484DRAFT_1905190 [Baffinella frigidus]|nr:hypothetical protein T484DRAFT_1905190 [Cryptophyta sp. CCMP2293]
MANGSKGVSGNGSKGVALRKVEGGKKEACSQAEGGKKEACFQASGRMKLPFAKGAKGVVAMANGSKGVGGNGSKGVAAAEYEVRLKATQAAAEYEVRLKATQASDRASGRVLALGEKAVQQRLAALHPETASADKGSKGSKGQQAPAREEVDDFEDAWSKLGK